MKGFKEVILGHVQFEAPIGYLVGIWIGKDRGSNVSEHFHVSRTQLGSLNSCSYIKAREADIPQSILLPEGKCTLIVLKASSQVRSVRSLTCRCATPISNFVFTELSLCLSGSLISFSFLL